MFHSVAHNSSLRRAGSLIATILLVLVILAAAFSIFAPYIGWKVDIVLSGSMEPAIHTGSMIVTRPIVSEAIQVGDIIRFSSPMGSSFFCHRVVAIENEPGLRFITKGDANRDADMNPVLPNQVAGIVALTIPYLGYLFAFIRTPLGLVLFVGIPVLVIVASGLDSLWSGDEE